MRTIAMDEPNGTKAPRAKNLADASRGSIPFTVIKRCGIWTTHSDRIAPLVHEILISVLAKGVRGFSKTYRIMPRRTRLWQKRHGNTGSKAIRRVLVVTNHCQARNATTHGPEHTNNGNTYAEVNEYPIAACWRPVVRRRQAARRRAQPKKSTLVREWKETGCDFPAGSCAKWRGKVQSRAAPIVTPRGTLNGQ